VSEETQCSAGQSVKNGMLWNMLHGMCDIKHAFNLCQPVFNFELFVQTCVGNLVA